jgi:hypothetical protein
MNPLVFVLFLAQFNFPVEAEDARWFRETGSYAGIEMQAGPTGRPTARPPPREPKPTGATIPMTGRPTENPGKEAARKDDDSSGSEEGSRSKEGSLADEIDGLNSRPPPDNGKENHGISVTVPLAKDDDDEGGNHVKPPSKKKKGQKEYKPMTFKYHNARLHVYLVNDPNVKKKQGNKKPANKPPQKRKKKKRRRVVRRSGRK